MMNGGKNLGWALFTGTLLGCSSSSSSASSDAAGSHEAGSTDAHRSSVDAGQDAGHDTGLVVDASREASADVAADVASEASLNACAGYKYCDGFEGYDAGAITNAELLGPWKATVNGTGIVMEIDDTKAFTGSKSLRVSVPSNVGEDSGTSAQGTLHQNADGGLVPGNDVFGRAMIFYVGNDAGTGLPTGVHSWLYNAEGFSEQADGSVTMNMGNAPKMQLNYHYPPPKNEVSQRGGTVTTGVWHCVQWEYDGSGTPPVDQGRVWLDGTEIVDVAKDAGWEHATPWSSFDFGFTHYQSLTNAVDIYLDDFALDGAMIPCPK